MEGFKELGLHEDILKAIAELKFTEPTEIQRKAIPLTLAGKDIIAGSATGSGKTLAFGASIIQNMTKEPGVEALILTPTRELAEQVGKTIGFFAKHKRIPVALVYGGVNIYPQIQDLRRAKIVVGTPGRILDHLERRTLDLSKVKTLVLDEADRMLDMGFIEDVERIISLAPKERQTLLFSATISPDIVYLTKNYMNHPVEITTEVYVDASKLVQIYYDVPRNHKFSLLVHLLKNEKAGLVMVFCNTRRNTDIVASHLEEQGIDVLAIHGGLTQNRRSSIINKFHASKVLVLVCTDVAARGLDIPNVSHVYNYDIPPNSKEYIHRIGRTARAGTEGKAINLVTDRDYDNFRSILRDPSLKVQVEPVPEMEQIRIRIGGAGGSSFGGRSGSRFGRDSRGGDRGRSSYGSHGRSAGSWRDRSGRGDRRPRTSRPSYR